MGSVCVCFFSFLQLSEVLVVPSEREEEYDTSVYLSVRVDSSENPGDSNEGLFQRGVTVYLRRSNSD